MTVIAPGFVGGLPGGPEMLIIAGIAVLLFGANKIPKIARSFGQASGEFKKGRQELEQELEGIEDDVETTVSERGESTHTDTNPTPDGDG